MKIDHYYYKRKSKQYSLGVFFVCSKTNYFTGLLYRTELKTIIVKNVLFIIQVNYCL